MSEIVYAIKSVKQRYEPTPELLDLLNEFRCMVNDCIRIGLREGVTSLKSLSIRAYKQLSAYDVPSMYKLTAISAAAGILRNHRRALKQNPRVKVPHARRLRLTDCYAFKLLDGRLRITIRSKHHTWLSLNFHTRRVLSDPRIEVRSIMLTPESLSITYAKMVEEIKLKGLIGIDRNLDNITIASTENEIKRYDLSKATDIKSKYREVKSHFARNDVRVGKRIFRKYGEKQRNKVSQILHHVSKDIVEKAKANGFGIVMENIKGIRRLYRKGNWQGRKYRSRLNSWSFYELQCQIEYKAKWEGIPVICVPPQKTSSTCATCGCRITECAERKVWCPKCGALEDRDVNAARNILAKGGLRFGPNALPSEAVVEEPQRTSVILKVDGSECVYAQ